MGSVVVWTRKAFATRFSTYLDGALHCLGSRGLDLGIDILRALKVVWKHWFVETLEMSLQYAETRAR
jgi:hypothetical protein